MAVTFTPGKTFVDGEIVTFTDLNGISTGMAVNMGAKKLLGTTTAGAGVEVAYTDAGLAMLQAASANAQAALLGTTAGIALLQATDLAAQQTILGIAPIQGRTTGNFDKVANTTLANVTGLSLTLEAGQAYSIEGLLRVDQDTTGRAKYALSGTATMTSVAVDLLPVCLSSAIAIAGLRISELNSETSTIGGIAQLDIIIRGVVVVNAGGTLTVQFAQNSASGTSSVLSGSYIRAVKF